jgi:SAM-dependent methyltransferase
MVIPRPLYVLMRMARRALPGPVARAMLETGILLKPGLETREPEEAVDRYLGFLESHGGAAADRQVLVFGYGGCFGVGLALLRHGARRVTLCDRFARPHRRRNAAWRRQYPEWFLGEGSRILPDPARLRLLHVDIREYARQHGPEFDLVLSSSVFEHLDDADGVAGALAGLTLPGGVNLHYIDVRDHFFRLPFEMLAYSEVTWRRLLDPPSHLNRLRPWDHLAIFRRHFAGVEMRVEQGEPAAFHRSRNRIRPEFLSGDDGQDAAGVISVYAAGRLPGT